MARTTRKKSTRTSGKRKTATRWTLPSLDGGEVARFALVVMWLLLGGGVCAAWAVGVPHLRTYAAQRLASEEIEIVLVDLPAWLEDNEAAGSFPATELRDLAAAQLTGDPLDHASLEATRVVLQLSGWFASVDRVERVGSNRVEVRGRYVQPFAVVRDASGNHLVDRQARLLPRTYSRDAWPPNLSLVVGARSSRPGFYGEVWKGPGLAAALALAELLDAQAWRSQVTAIDISEYAFTDSIWLATEGGARILWGRAPGGESGVEVPARQKLEYLRKLHADSGAIDGHMTWLDITGHKVYTSLAPPSGLLD